MLGSPPVAGEGAIDDHSADALLTAADDPRMGPDIPFERPPFTDVEPRLRPRKP
jgi:hypothetical protein